MGLGALLKSTSAVDEGTRVHTHPSDWYCMGFEPATLGHDFLNIRP